MENKILNNQPCGLLNDGKTLKLLAITSSFGLNTTEYLYDIAVSEGYTDVVVARLYTSGCTLKKHMDFAANHTAGYEYTKKSGTDWTAAKGVAMDYGISDEDWDVIFLQQSAEQSPIESSYADYVPQLMDYVRQRKPDAKFVWNMTWAFDKGCSRAVFDETFAGNQRAMYEAIVHTLHEKILKPKLNFARIIPTGTAIQNARLAGSPKLTRDTFGGGTVDHIHLNAYGRLIAGYTLFAMLTDQKELAAVNVGDIPPAYHYPDDPLCILTAEDKRLIIEAVNNAIKNPWTVTDSVRRDKSPVLGE